MCDLKAPAGHGALKTLGRLLGGAGERLRGAAARQGSQPSPVWASVSQGILLVHLHFVLQAHTPLWIKGPPYSVFQGFV